MSNAILYDPPLVSALAAELHERFAGAPLASLPRWGEELSVALVFSSGDLLRADLHPTRGWFRRLGASGRSEESEWRLTRVGSPPDERILWFDLEGGNRFRPLRRRLIVELHTNQWNAVLVEPESEAVVSVLRRRAAGARLLSPGARYVPPPPRTRIAPATHPREESWESWKRLLGDSPPEERRRNLIRDFAATGTLNAVSILAPLEEGRIEALRESFDRWWKIAAGPALDPVVLDRDGRLHPYPFPLPDDSYRRVDSLLTAMAEIATAGADVGRASLADQASIAEIRRRFETAERRIARLAEQSQAASDGAEARRFGDLILANLQGIPRGADRVTLADWEGGEITIELDPTLGAAENATRWYDVARRQQRALERLPPLIRDAEADRDRWKGILVRVEELGEVPDDVRQELARHAPMPDSTEPGSVRLPYRLFRTSGGLEVRVGRGAADNDRLTFGHSSPNDVWLHARSVTGSHVVLRWPDADQHPPARDLTEAATLAACFSKARTSGTVAVDWTRRKHVRKPRGAPPGSVIPSRVKTVFVEPDAGLAERLEVGML